MNRLEELTFNLADDALTDKEAAELVALAAQSDKTREAHIQILQIEAGLRAGRQNLDLAPAIMARLQAQLADSIARGVMSEIKSLPAPAPDWQEVPRQRRKRLTAKVLPFPFFFRRNQAVVAADVRRRISTILDTRLSASSPRRLLNQRAAKPVLLALAACITLVAGVWLFGPTMGEPVLAEVQGFGLSLERAGQSIPAVAGTRLQSGDLLRAPSNVTAIIGFAPENTSVTLQPGTQLKLAGISHGTHFDLRLGKLEATVARQRAFQPMIITTRQAEARVLGTKFSLLTTTNATRLDVTEGKVKLTRLSDDTAVKVGAGRYAVATASYELTALPQTGGLLQEWWTSVKGKTRFSLSDDPRFPDHPDGRTTVPDFELTIAETNQFAVRLCGYVHPPVTGEYRFWLESPPADFAAVGFANLMMSPTESSSEAVQIAQTGGGGMVTRYVTGGTTEAPPPIPLVAGRRYYIEARILIGRGKGELSVAWQPPGQSREVLSGKFLSPFKPK